MFVHVFRAKLHRVTVTEANLHYMGSITIDEDLLDASGILPHEKVQVVNINNGERFETYVIKGERGSGVMCLNGPAARLVQVGDKIIVIAYGMMTLEEARTFTPVVLYPGDDNLLPKK
jgi:aspartate 1-decarboxylase